MIWSSQQSLRLYKQLTRWISVYSSKNINGFQLDFRYNAIYELNKFCSDDLLACSTLLESSRIVKYKYFENNGVGYFYDADDAQQHIQLLNKYFSEFFNIFQVRRLLFIGQDFPRIYYIFISHTCLMKKSTEPENDFKSPGSRRKREQDPTVKIDLDEKDFNDQNHSLKKKPSIFLIKNPSKSEEIPNKIEQKSQKRLKYSQMEPYIQKAQRGLNRSHDSSMNEKSSFTIEQDHSNEGLTEQIAIQDVSKNTKNSQAFPRILDVSEIQDFQENMESMIIQEDTQINIEAQLSTIILESKLKDKYLIDLREVIDGKKSISDIEKQVRGPYRPNFRTKMHDLLQRLSKQRMNYKTTDKQKQLKILLKSYNIDTKLIQGPQDEFLKNIKSLLKQESGKFIQSYDFIMKNFEQKEESMEEQLTVILGQVQIEEPEEIEDCLRLYSENKIEQLLDYCSEDYRPKLQNSLKKLSLKKNKNTQNSTEKIKKQLITLLKQVQIDEQEDLQNCINHFLKGQYDDLKQYPSYEYQQYFAERLKPIIQKLAYQQPQQKRNQNPEADLDQIINIKLMEILRSAGLEDQIQECLILFKQNKIDDLKDYPGGQYKDQFVVKIDQLIQFRKAQQSLIKKQSELKEAEDFKVLDCQAEEKEQNIFDAEKQLLAICKQITITKQSQIESCLVHFRNKDIPMLKKVPKKSLRQRFGLLVDQLLHKIKVHNEKETEKKFDKIKQLKKILNIAGIKDEKQIQNCIELFKNQQLVKLKGQPKKSMRAQFQILLNELILKVQQNEESKPNQIIQISVPQQLKKIFEQVGITKEQIIKKGIQMFEQNKIEDLLLVPTKRHRPLLKELLKQLQMKIKNIQSESDVTFDADKQLIKLLEQYQINSEEQIEQCLSLFRRRNPEDIIKLKDYPSSDLQTKFSRQIDELLEKIKNSQSKQNSFDWKDEFKNICGTVFIEEEDVDQCLQLFKNGQVKTIVQDYCPLLERQKAKILLDQLLAKFQQINNKSNDSDTISKDQYSNIENELIKSFIDAKIDSSLHTHCLQLFRDNKISQLIKIPKTRYRETLNATIDRLKAKLNQIGSEQKQKSIRSQLLSLLDKANIKNKQQIQICLRLYDEGKFEDLKKAAKPRFRQQFSQGIDKLVPNQASVNKNYVKQIKKIFKEAQIESDDQQVCLKLFQDEKVQQIAQYASMLKRNYLKVQLSNLLKIIQQSMPKKKTLEDIFNDCHIEHQKHEEIKSQLEQGDYTYLLSLPQTQRRILLNFVKELFPVKNPSLETKILIQFTPHMNQNQIIELINQIKNDGKHQYNLTPKLSELLSNIEKDYMITLTLNYSSNKSKSISFNQLLSRVKWIKHIEQLIKISDLTSYHIFIGQQKIDIEKYDFKINEQYVLQIFETKQYKCRYCGKTRKIELLPNKPISFNKQIIFRKLIENKDLIYNQPEPFEANKMTLKFETQLKTIQKGYQMTIQNIQQQIGQIITIDVEVKIKVTIFYDEIQQDYTISSCSEILKVRNIINQNYVPFQSQILNLIKSEQNKIQLDNKNDREMLGNIDSHWNLRFQLINRCSFENYGFHENVPLSFEKFSQFFVENQEATRKLIKNCSFSIKKEEQHDFRQHFFSYVYSGIKKRFPIESIIQKFKKYVSQQKYESIWKSSSQDEAIKVNAAFVLSYILKNADSRLRIQLMNLLKDNMTLPLYFKQYENITKVSDINIKLNDDLLWILKDGLTVTSIGLHTKNIELQTGKSSLLNQIFPLEFEQTQNKHAIIKGIPFISLRVFYNIFPLHVIDIPHDCPEPICTELLKNTNLILLHSWQNEAQTEVYISKLKALYNTPIICLLRDCKDINGLKSLKENYLMEQKIQKICNFSKKKNVLQQMTILKQQIFKFINKKVNSEKYDMTKIFGLYKQNKNYREFNSLISVVQKKMFDMAPIGKLMMNIKQLERQSNDGQISKIKAEIVQKVRPQIMDIVSYLTKDEVKPYQSLLLSLLRQKIKTYQNQLNLKYIRIYEFRDFFVKNIKEITPAETRDQNIITLNEKLQFLVDLKPTSIIGLKDDEIKDIISKMIDQYENKIKPEIFSVELFWRELNYLTTVSESYKVGKTSISEVLKQLKQLEINSNSPFEIIDGDLLDMPRKLMRSLFQCKQDRAIVITILGPQSSGKSTLLNFLFGCDFATSQGRCTRGVYGTYFKFAQNRSQFNQLSHCQGVFVIDTEGLFALTNDKDNNNQERKNFDAKLVLFCLAVSDFVVLNVRGNVDNNTEKIFRLCHQRLQQLNIDKDNRPEIVVVLNQNTSDRKQQSETQFKEIRKTIEFDLSQSLTLAYQVKNFGHEEISLFGKNQKLTKKYPQESFLKETSTLMNGMLAKIAKKKNISPLQETMQKFERIWSMVVAFPDLSKAVTKQYRQLENRIKTWKNSFDEQEKNDLSILFDRFKQGKISQQIIMDQINTKQKNQELLFDKVFQEKNTYDEQTKFLIRQERAKILSKSLVLAANVRYELENIKLKKQITLSKIQGDYNLKQKAKQIVGNQVNLTQEQKRVIFDQYFNEQLEKIEKTTNLGQQIHRQYNAIYDNYLFLIRQQTGSQKGLPRGKGWIGDEKCDVETMNRIIKKQLIEPNEKNYEDVLVHTNKIHTNTLKGGRTDATLEYFNMNDYFKTESITQFYCIDKHIIQSILKKELLRQMYKIKIQEANQKFNLQKELLKIWEEINDSLSTIGLKFTNKQLFFDLFEVYQGKFFAKFVDFFKNTRQQMQYKFIKKPQQQYRQKLEVQSSDSSDNSHDKYSRNFNRNSGTRHSFDRTNNHLVSRKIVDHSRHKLSRFINQYIDTDYYHHNCICSYTNKEPASYLLPRFYKHINWEQVLKEIKNISDHKRKIISVNENLTQMINEDIKVINLKICDYVDWKQVLDSTEYSYYKNTIRFSEIQANSVPSYQVICSMIEGTQYINHRQFKNNLMKVQKLFQGSSSLPLFAVKTSKLQPKENSSYLNAYLKKDTKLTIQQLKKPQFKQYIFNELKNHNKKSFDLFFSNIFKIVNDVLSSWQNIQKKTYAQIYHKINQEISKFNNDLNQISCNLSERYIGYIHSATIYMIWKLIIDKKIKQKREIYKAKKNEYENQWERFKARTSLDEKANVQSDVNQFIKEFVDIVREVIAKTKKSYMEKQKKQFSKVYSRDIIQDKIDRQVFSNKSTDEQKLEYLESPFDVIIRKYVSCYDQSWKYLCSNYLNETITKDIIQELYELLIRLQQLFTDNNIDETKRNFSDIFEIVDKEGKIQDFQITQQEYELQGKRVLFEYFIDTLLCQNPLKPRKCTKIEVKPVAPLNIITKASPTLTGLLVDLKVVKYLSLTNMAMFVNRLASKQVRDKITQQIIDLNKLTEDKDKPTYIDMIKVLVCTEKCPCCGRICGLQNQHQHHKCIYGHQMRGLNGTYIRKDNGVKEASVVRCEYMAGNDMLEYNSKQMTWVEFTQYWKNKTHGGWLYDDSPLTKDSKKELFDDAWTAAGQLYCNKHNIQYVSCNKSNDQKQAAQSVGAIHYIFALDCSSSMGGTPWTNLIKSFKQTIQKIKAKDANRNQTKVSLIVFDSVAKCEGQNQAPNQINTNPTFRNGGTNFDPPFNMAAGIATNYIANSTVVFIFMTDGGASYPSAGIKALKDLMVKHPNKFKYAGIEFNINAPVMKTIATELNGKTGTAYNPEQLTKLFMKSIEVVEYREGPSPP